MDDTSGRIDIDTTRPRGAAENDIPRAAASARAAEEARAYAAGESGDEVDARTKRIREEIENTRGEMTETIEAIQEKLKPGNIVANATERVKSATTERVRDMADTANQTAQQAMDYTRDTASSVVNMARQNPIPLALLGLGAAWWLTSRSRPSSSSFDRSAYGRDHDSGRPNDQYGYGWSNRATESGDGALRQVAARTREYASDAAGSVRRTARRRKNQLQRTIEQNPLLVGAGALLVGAAFGLAIPETEAENEWMGETRDSVVGRARDLARDAATQVQEAADGLVDKVITSTDTTKQ